MKNVLLCLLMKHAQELLYLPWNDMPVISFCTLVYANLNLGHMFIEN